MSNSGELIERCQRGERAAFDELFDAYKGDINRIVFRLVGPSPEFEDLVQDVFVQVFRSIIGFKGNSQFTTWLYRVAVNVVLMHKRALRSRPQLVAEDCAPVALDERASPEEQAARARRVRAFYGLVNQLSEKKRTVFILHELERLSPVEIAKVVGAPVLTVRTRLFYARRDLESLLRLEPELVNALKALTDARGDDATSSDLEPEASIAEAASKGASR